jgi:hypothetical protein
MNAVSKIPSLAQSLADMAITELLFFGDISNKSDNQAKIVEYIEIAADAYECVNGVSVDVGTILEARAILDDLAEAELERVDQEEISELPGSFRMNIAGVTSWYRQRD